MQERRSIGLGCGEFLIGVLALTAIPKAGSAFTRGGGGVRVDGPVTEAAVGPQAGWWIGRGCAAVARPVKIGPAMLRLAEQADGTVRIATAHHEIGNGLYTLLATMHRNG